MVRQNLVLSVVAGLPGAERTTLSLRMLARFIDGLRLLTVLAGGHRTLALENLALRQQLAMYTRTRRRPAIRWSDRLFWLGLRRAWSDWSAALVILRPATVIGWLGAASPGTGPGSRRRSVDARVWARTSDALSATWPPRTRCGARHGSTASS